MHLNPHIATLLNGLNNPSLPGIDLSLERMKQLLDALGNPERNLPPVIHVAGTNGKGSTIAFLRAIYEAAGYKVHVYTSPHLVRFNERIVLASQEISDDELLKLLETITAAAHDIPVTFFEATTAAAFLAFAHSKADVVLLETGLGGRLDATNMVPSPLATVITPIDYDHMEFLGDSLANIATEKAGIIKSGAPCFAGKQLPDAANILCTKAQAMRANLYLHGQEWNYHATTNGVEVEQLSVRWQLPLPSLPGAHQQHNAALASVVAMSLPSLPITISALQQGIASAQWPARLHQLTHGPLVDAWSGTVMLDGGHNISAARVLRDWIAQQPVTLLLGMMKRKDARAFLEPLAPLLAAVITTSIPENESYDAQALATIARELGITAIAIASLDEAPAQLHGRNGILLIAGSLFLAGAVLKNHG